MNWDIIEGNWKEWKGKARQQWGELTDDELEKAKGGREELIGLVQQKYGWAYERAEQEVEDWRERLAG